MVKALTRISTFIIFLILQSLELREINLDFLVAAPLESAWKELLFEETGTLHTPSVQHGGLSGESKLLQQYQGPKATATRQGEICSPG